MSGDVNTPPPPAPTPAPTRNGPRHVVSRGISEEWLEQDLRRFNRQKAYFANYAHYGPIRRNMMLVASATPFEVGIYVVLVLNCFFLGVQNIKSLQSIQTASVTLDAVFTSCYVAEMIFKLIALGPRMYLSRYWNWIDGSLAIASATGLIVYYSVPSATSTLPTILRVFQLIRPLRMLTALSALRVLLRALGASVRRLGNVAVLTGAFMTLMALIALAFFRFCFENECQTVQLSGIDTISNGSVVFEGLQLYQDDLAPVCVASGNIPQPFWLQRNSSGPSYNPSDVEFIANTLANATTTVLPVAALNDNYNGLVCPFGAYCVPGVGKKKTWVSLYFIANVVVGTIFVLNLVLATVSDAFGRSIKYQMRFTRSSKEYKNAIGNPNGTWSGMIIPAGLSMMTLPTTTVADIVHKI
ncbi:voltage-gated sodium channel protein, putative, partial [Bodo saltans]